MPLKNSTKLDIDYLTIIDNATIEKLESAFVIGATDAEACLFAGIEVETLQKYCQSKPDFLTTKNELRNRSILLAKQELKKGIKGNPQLALRYLESNIKQESKINENQKLNMTNEQKQKELGLNDKQRFFCEEYLANKCDALMAYSLVYKTKSERVASANASRMLTNANIAAYLTFLKIPKSLELSITKESQLKELDRIKQLAQIPDASGKVQWASVVKIVEVQNKMLGLDAPTKLELTGKDGGAIETTVTSIIFKKD